MAVFDLSAAWYVPPMDTKRRSEDYTEQEAQERFEAALKSALNTPHRPLKDKPKVKKAKRKPKRQEQGK
jgi:hypothetical protein